MEIIIISNLFKRVLIFLTSFLFISCSTNIKPSWVNNPSANIGVCGFIPSENFSKQKNIALKKAINAMMIKKGYISGSVYINSIKIYKELNTQENIQKQFNQNSNIKFSFKDIKYNVKITDIWKDEKTGEVYVRIKEVSNEK